MTSRTAFITKQSGFSLIELMVVVVITLLMSLAVFGVLSTSESKKRTATSVNDIDQAGSYAMYVMEKQIRSAGSGLHGGSSTDYGCELEASKGGTAILPTTANSLPPEFSMLAGGSPIFRVVPIVIAAKQALPYASPWNGSSEGSDFFIVMAGSSGISEYPVPFTSAPNATSGIVTLANAIGVTANDVALLTDVTVGSAPSPCIIESVSPTFTYSYAPATTLVPISGGTYTTTTASPKALSTFSEGGAFLNLGQAPMMQLFGVGNNTTLFSYDLLQGTLNAANQAVSQALASGVFEMKALYAIDTSTLGDGSTVSWVDPSVAPWDYTTLTNGSSASILALKQIKAIRLGIVMRTQLPENTCVNAGSQTLRGSCTVISQAPPTLFNGVLDANGNSLAYTVTLSAADKVYRYKTFENTIPLRNNLIFP